VGWKRYECPGIIAPFISPKVCLLHSLDPSITEYTVEIDDLHNQFPLFVALARGSIPVDDDTRAFLLSLSRELGNFDVFFSILDHCEFAFDGVSGFCGEVGGVLEGSIGLSASRFHRLSDSTFFPTLSSKF
jgi:hypothetical protein